MKSGPLLPKLSQK